MIYITEKIFLILIILFFKEFYPVNSLSSISQNKYLSNYKKYVKNSNKKIIKSTIKLLQNEIHTSSSFSESKNDLELLLKDNLLYKSNNLENDDVLSNEEIDCNYRPDYERIIQLTPFYKLNVKRQHQEDSEVNRNVTNIKKIKEKDKMNRK